MTTVPARNLAAECVGSTHQCVYHASGGEDAWCSAYVRTPKEPTPFEKAKAVRPSFDEVLAAASAPTPPRKPSILVREGPRSYEMAVIYKSIHQAL